MIAVSDTLLKVEGSGNDFVLGTGAWARRVADDPPLRKGAFGERVDVAFIVADMRQSAGEAGRLHHADQVAREDFAGVALGGAARVRAEALRAVEMAIGTCWRGIAIHRRRV